MDFMKKGEDHLDKDDKLQMERLIEMNRMILEQMKKTIKKKLETKKRSCEDEAGSNAQSKPRVTSPPKA